MKEHTQLIPKWCGRQIALLDKSVEYELFSNIFTKLWGALTQYLNDTHFVFTPLTREFTLGDKKYFEQRRKRLLNMN